ncbi:reverse transcriptase domain-containing protein [Tanacetum coccineum]
MKLLINTREINNDLKLTDCHSVPKKGGITVITNDENELIPTRLVTGWRIPVDPKDQEKTTFTCPYGTFAYRRMPFGLCNAPGTFQRCMMAIFHDMIEKTMEVFMDDFSVFGDSFSTCLSHLEKMLKRSCVSGKKLRHSQSLHRGPIGGHMVPITQQERSLTQDSIGPPSKGMPTTLSPILDIVNVKENLRNVMRCHKNLHLSLRNLYIWGNDFMGAFPSSEEQVHTRGVDSCQNGLKQKALPQ